MRKLKAFTWGYWGWGSESKHFVRAVDWMEKKRGFLPPVFVDLRFARNGKAANFKGREFEKIVGSRRYVWMPKLGNKRIKSKKGKPIQIADPGAASDLLNLMIGKVKKRQRVIMFCACEEPLLKMDDGYPSCHRVEVASLLLREAKKRGLKVELAEWPGESPVSIRVKANESQRRALGNDARYIPLGAVDKRMPSMAVLGWGQWRLEVVHDGTYTGRGAEIFARKRGESLLRAGYGPRSTRR